MKSLYLVVGIIAVIAIVGYLGRHQIKTMLSGTPTPTLAPVAKVTPPPSVTPTATTSANVVTTKSSSAKGSYLVAMNGMTLYIFDKDKPGVSNCAGSCAVLWPPYVTTTVPTTLPVNVSTIKRADGSMQFTYKNMPLYYYTPDKQPGDVLGDGVGSVWHLVKP